ncbi:hypothetical protein ACP70R_049283 [Stipagrostis hirtigluma subsp. patula]
MDTTSGKGTPFTDITNNNRGLLHGGSWAPTSTTSIFLAATGTEWPDSVTNTFLAHFLILCWQVSAVVKVVPIFLLITFLPVSASFELTEMLLAIFLLENV